METIDEAKGFEETLLDDPAQWDVRLIFADWLEERGREAEAAFQRYVVKHKLVPILNRNTGWYDWRKLNPPCWFHTVYRSRITSRNKRRQLEAAYKDLV